MIVPRIQERYAALVNDDMTGLLAWLMDSSRCLSRRMRLTGASEPDPDLVQRVSSAI